VNSLPDVFALLDDRDATARHPTSRLYTGFVREHRCTDPHALEACCAALEADQRAGLHAVVLGDYEWGAKLLGAGTAKLAADDGAALRFLVFERLQHLDRDAVSAWLAEREDRAAPGAAGLQDTRESVTPDEFRAAIAAIHEAIRAGETYQVNYTYRIDAQAYGSPLALYRRLRAVQPVPYGAFIALPDGHHVLSCSPELFVRHHAGLAEAKPMKGTAPRAVRPHGPSFVLPEGDSITARWLHEDVKNRAENLMIVDLLRNDLGRIAVTGSVKVPHLFAIEGHPTVFQMTSTVQAELPAERTLPELLRATFPCGSITGAPKHHTMDLIAQLESTPRGLYTGAIGWLDAAPAGRRLGDFCWSVAIRTLMLAPADDQGLRAARLGIGAGMVLDSVADDELAECRLKGSFLTRLDPGFTLFETMHADRDGGIRHLERHLARLSGSAARLGFRCDVAAIEHQVRARAAALGDGPHRLRLDLSHDGSVALRDAPLGGSPSEPVGLCLAAGPVSTATALLTHKTSVRDDYDAAVRAAEQAGAFDTLFFNAAGHLTEGGRSNVFVRLDGRWWTPPVHDGLLPGVMRAAVLANPQWQAAERSITRDELLRAEALMVTNALRGALPARLLLD
jgi:para-aminobenzoate synthetase/4-amino-4-deoxychorismate lyase